MDAITVKAAAKLNLFLEVKERMSDGYHKIESIMQSVSLYDTLTFRKTSGVTSVSCNNKRLENDSNLVIKAVNAFFEHSKIKGGVSVDLKKIIPVSAGLGGGSSDAASTLKALNELYGSPLPEDKLYGIAKTLGADVPFCLKRGLCRAFGIGEVLEELKPLPPCLFVIAKGNNAISTKEAFDFIDKHKNRQIRNSDGITNSILNGDIDAICEKMYNAFEINGDCDANIKRIMKKHNAYNALMSGSGPSVFGVFKDRCDAENAESELIASGYECYICQPENAGG